MAFRHHPSDTRTGHSTSSPPVCTAPREQTREPAPTSSSQLPTFVALGPIPTSSKGPQESILTSSLMMTARPGTSVLRRPTSQIIRVKEPWGEKGVDLDCCKTCVGGHFSCLFAEEKSTATCCAKFRVKCSQGFWKCSSPKQVVFTEELDLKAFKLVGERHHLWRGAVHGGVFVEGPHMYKHEGSYYLMAAEGGTGVNHAEVIAISFLVAFGWADFACNPVMLWNSWSQGDKVTGPFYPNDRNPILTSRHLSYDNWVHSTGHGDLFQLPDGRWYMVCLGVRAEEGQPGKRRSNMGRETHLVPVRWEREQMEWHSLGPLGERLWPVCAPDTGRVERQTALPFKSMQLHSCNTFRDTFESPSLHPEWNFRRVPKEGMYALSPGCLRLNSQPQVIEERVSCSLMGVRQRQSEFTFLAKMAFKPTTDGVEAGTSVFQKDDNYVNFVVQLVGGKHRLCVTLKGRDQEERTLKADDLPAYEGSITFKIESCNHAYHFAYSLDDGANFTSVAETAADHLLSYGYTGSYLGVYCTSRGKPSTDYAEYAFVQHTAALRLPTTRQEL